MAISSTTRKTAVFIGNGTSTVFPFTFKVFTAADLEVVRLQVSTSVETVLVITTNYTVSLNTDQESNPGGSITLLVALAVGQNLVITSTIAILQPTDLQNQGGFFPNVIDDSLDRITIIAQQIQEQVDRSAKLPITSAAAADDLVADLVRLADSATEIDIVANNITNVNAVGADLLEPVSEINTVAVDIANVNTVGTSIAAVNTCSTNIAAIIAAPAQASAAATSATNAATSATAAANSATASATSATASAASATSAATQATNAATSATNAANSATTASTQATNAATSATAAAGSATSAATSATTATTQASNASTSATAAASSATAASTSAANAATSATNAATSAAGAVSSANAAAGSAAAAASSQTAAAASATSAAASYDSFDDRYLGAKASPPTLDNDGNALIAGALYYDTTLASMRVYDLTTTSWISITVATVTSISDQANTSTGWIDLPVGTTAQRGSPTSGAIRYNTTVSAFEGYSGSAWSSVGGGATGAGGDTVFQENQLIVTTSYTLSTGKSASSVGPITINGGAVVTVPSGYRWLVL